MKTVWLKLLYMGIQNAKIRGTMLIAKLDCDW